MKVGLTSRFLHAVESLGAPIIVLGMALFAGALVAEIAAAAGILVASAGALSLGAGFGVTGHALAVWLRRCRHAAQISGSVASMTR